MTATTARLPALACGVGPGSILGDFSNVDVRAEDRYDGLPTEFNDRHTL